MVNPQKDLALSFGCFNNCCIIFDKYLKNFENPQNKSMSI
jgi:hypothetical protein